MPQPDAATLGRIRELADGLDAMGNIEFEETLDTIIDGMGRQIRGVEVRVMPKDIKVAPRGGNIREVK